MTLNAENEGASFATASSGDKQVDIFPFFCAACQICIEQSCGGGGLKLQKKVRANGGNGPLHHTYKDWQDAVRSGCYICRLLQERVPSSIKDTLSRKKTIRDVMWFSYLVPWDETPRSMSIVLCGHRLEFALRRVDRRASKIIVRDAGETTNSSSAWDTVFKWLDNCNHTHESCNQTTSQEPSWYPTRLLDLGGTENEIWRVKVIETAKERLKGLYITLSHCWGAGVHLLLTKQNRDGLLDELPSLPKTFAEAVSACRKLGIRYLWIDSLCIIQDDLDDWEREASLMHRVYKRAWCNLSAAASRDSSEGLYRERNQIVSELRFDPSSSAASFAILEKGLFKHQVEKSPLQDRAWVLQERLLSPRILHFGEKQIFWECNQLTACEAFPDGLPEGMNQSKLREIFNSTLSDPISAWDSVLQNYTNRAITRGSDRLIALSGIVDYLSPILDGEYVAGIWNNKDIAYQLAWSTKRGRSELRPRPQYRAPTWSWASIDDTVSLMDAGDRKDLHLKVLEATVVTTGTNATGAVKHASLLVQGHLKWVSADDRDEYIRTFELYYDAGDDDIGKLFFTLLYSSSSWGPAEKYEEDDTHYNYYLILDEDPDRPACYRRRGLASNHYYDGDEDPSDRIFQHAGKYAPCEEFLGLRDGHKFWMI